MRIALAFAAAAAAAAAAADMDPDWGLKHGIIWYSRAGDEGRLDLVARRYQVGISGKDDGIDAERAAIVARNPGFRWFVYNSGTDNYVESRAGTPEHDLLAALAVARGWDVEEAYLHYWDDTRVVLEGDTILIPGWGGGSAAHAAAARVPVYSRTLSRRAVHFATPRAAQLHRETFVRLAFETPFATSNVYAAGIFVDNAAAQFFNFGTILSGGRVREAPGRPQAGSREHQEWHWNANLGPFLTGLKDTLEAAASWARDGERKHLMINVANLWNDGYVSRDAADVLFLEFQYNPVRNVGPRLVDEAYRRNTIAAAAGIATFYSAGMTRSVQGRRGELAPADVMLGNLVWYLVTRTPETLFYEMGTNAPSAAGWDTLTWRGCIDVAGRQLGRPLGGPFTLARGVDPLGNPYEVKARRYERGAAVLRNRGSWDEGIEPETAVTVTLPAPMAPVSPAGRIGVVVQEIRLRNGGAALLLGDTSHWPP
jgi:hypothetical protein